jgi:hypothetical protein
MAFIEDVFKGGNIATGLGVGLGMVVLGPVVLPVVGAVVRPLAKTVVKMGMSAYDAAAEGMAGAADATTGTAAGNIFTEARAELDAERAARPAGPERPKSPERPHGAAARSG